MSAVVGCTPALEALRNSAVAPEFPLQPQESSPMVLGLSFQVDE
jgi:hypothetical protein